MPLSNGGPGSHARLDFAVVGAVKAATTWMQKQLQRDRRVYMPDPEPHFFSRDYSKGFEYYSGFFEGVPVHAALRGEKSADYLAHPEAAARMAAYNPDLRLVTQLRDPVERAYSDYKMLFRRGTLEGPPEDFLTVDSDFPRFLEDGLYGKHLERWLDHFPANQLLVYPFEDVEDDPQGAFEAVSAHIGLSPPYPSVSMVRENDSASKILPQKVREVMAPFKQAVAPLRGTYLFETARDALAAEIAYPPMSSDLRKRLRDYYSKDIEKVESLTGRRMPRWQRQTANFAQC